MGLRKYTVAEFRKNIREAFNAIDNGNSVYITRHGVRYEVRKADVQPGKKQIADMNAGIVAQTSRKVAEDVSRHKDREVVAAIDSVVGFPENGDPMAQIDTPAPKKNIADADASEVGRIRSAIAAKQAELDMIDIETQDPDEVEKGSQLAADIDELRRALSAHGYAA